MRVLGKRLKTTVELIFDDPVKGFRQTLAAQLRGGILTAFQGSEFHQHDSNGDFIYRYPRIQYQWRHKSGVVVGWMESAEKLLQLPWLDLSLQVNGVELRATDVFLNPASVEFGVSERLCHYRLATPVLLFNQKNYANYKLLKFTNKLYEEDRLLQAQVLTALRGLSVDFTERLYATFTERKTVSCVYKGQQLAGIQG
ncbi:MAG: CRISPR-associated endonuclease Cas6, partial [Desulforhabdus sp.]|nr:CRISPR-associated endonuclease Cas6 [Desulforhabdus sp.]